MENQPGPATAITTIEKRLPWLAAVGGALLACCPLWAQAPGAGGADSQTLYGNMIGAPQIVTITIGVRDSRGLPLEEKATVKLVSRLRGFSRIVPTEEGSIVSFPNVLEGPYEVEVQCPGYKPVADHLDVTSGLAFFFAYVYLHPENEAAPPGNTSKGLILTPKLAAEIDKGLASMRRHQYEAAKSHFTKADRINPNSSDVAYLMGTADLGLSQSKAAQSDFEKAVALDPANERALLALGELQIRSGDAAGAIATLNKAYTANGAGWRTQYLLATAYAKTGKLAEAELHASSAVRFSRTNRAGPLMLLGDIQAEEEKWPDARQTWDRIVAECSTCPEASDARKKISEASGAHPEVLAEQPTKFSHLALDPELPESMEERPWAPPDIDSKEYPVAPDASCNADDILPRGMRRTKLQLDNLEKFGATEHIEHQEIDKRGIPGPLKIHNFYYLVFVFPMQPDSVFLEETRDGGSGVNDFPTSLATTGLNSLGINILQTAYRSGFNYQCEGLTSVRGEAAWQVRFEEKKDAKQGVRRWQRSGTIFNIPLKGRFWLSSTSYDLLRIETDLREPIVDLELTRDHLLVDYGPVNFVEGKTKLWLPWSAEMYMELHGKRYHHKHFLTNYMLFGVDTSHKIGRPKNAPAEDAPPEDAPSPQTSPKTSPPSP